MKPLTEDIVVIRGGGDLATGVVQKFYRAGIKVVILEIAAPTAIRRTVALSQAVYDGMATVEDMTAYLIDDPAQCESIWAKDGIPMLIDPDGACLPALKPDGVIDAILAKRSLGTHASIAKTVIALGPGFTAPKDAHAVIETMRGHALGRVLFKGHAIANTGTPGIIGGKGKERVLRAPCQGVVTPCHKIGDILNEGDVVFTVSGKSVLAPFPGLLRGMIYPGLSVPAGMKIADIDPRTDSDWHAISDKARSIGGGALEAYLYLRRRIGGTQGASMGTQGALPLDPA